MYLPKNFLTWIMILLLLLLVGLAGWMFWALGKVERVSERNAGVAGEMQRGATGQGRGQ
jgi:hypothetical protein